MVSFHISYLIIIISVALLILNRREEEELFDFGTTKANSGKNE